MAKNKSKKKPTESKTRDLTVIPEQETHESGIVSPEKNEILKEHMEKYPEGDPAVRRVNPSRDEIGRNYIRPEEEPGKDEDQKESA